MSRERIGLLGGTFNPVHQGHLKAAAEALRKTGLSRILFIPSYIPPHKKTAGIASPEDRFAMVKLAVAGHPRFVASPVEIEAKERSYSVVTLGKVKAAYPDAWIFFILGIDAFLEIETWRSYQEVLGKCHFIVISRPGFRLTNARTVLDEPYTGWIHALRGGMPAGDDLLERFRIFIVPIHALDISSTDIRRRVKQGLPIRGLVPEAVEAYIKKRRLYQE
jgi:nicotinate-nucleotide adenylyltransferase